jgi:hypothetical protein
MDENGALELPDEVGSMKVTRHGLIFGAFASDTIASRRHVPSPSRSRTPD